MLCKEGSLTFTAGGSQYSPWGTAGGMMGTPNYAVANKKEEKPKEYRKVAVLKMLKDA